MLQTGTVHGGINLYRRHRPALPRPRQLPLDVARFVNRDDALTRLDNFVPAADVDTDQAPPRAGLVPIAAIAGPPGVGQDRSGGTLGVPSPAMVHRR